MIAADRLAGSGQGTSSRIIRYTRASGPPLFLPSSSFHTFKLLSPYPTVPLSNAPSPTVPLFIPHLPPCHLPPCPFPMPHLPPCPYSHVPLSHRALIRMFPSPTVPFSNAPSPAVSLFSCFPLPPCPYSHVPLSHRALIQ